MKAGLLLIALAGCGHGAASEQGGADPGAGKPTFTVTSEAFAANANIPAAHTCEGEDLAPPLAWSGAPAATKSYALIVDDPDAPDPAAPKKTHVHWVITDIPASTTSLPLGGALPAGAANGTNDSGNATWNGPCPPIGRHRYFFKLYALDAEHLGKPGMKKPELLAAMAGHVLAKGELVGTYQKQK
jgi:hypothetical protein